MGSPRVTLGPLNYPQRNTNLALKADSVVGAKGEAKMCLLRVILWCRYTSTPIPLPNVQGPGVILKPYQGLVTWQHESPLEHRPTFLSAIIYRHVFWPSLTSKGSPTERYQLSNCKPLRGSNAKSATWLIDHTPQEDSASLNYPARVIGGIRREISHMPQIRYKESTELDRSKLTWQLD